MVKVALITWWSPDKQGDERATRQRARTDGIWLLATLAASADLQMRKLPCRTVAAQRPRLTSSVVVSQSEVWVAEGGPVCAGGSDEREIGT